MINRTPEKTNRDCRSLSRVLMGPIPLRETIHKRLIPRIRYPPKGVGLRSNMGNCPQHCQTSKRKPLMKTRKSHTLAKSTPTLTQSGLLAVLLQHQRYKAIELAERRAHHNQSRTAFSSALAWMLSRVRGAVAGRPFHRGVGWILPRHP